MWILSTQPEHSSSFLIPHPSILRDNLKFTLWNKRSSVWGPREELRMTTGERVFERTKSRKDNLGQPANVTNLTIQRFDISYKPQKCPCIKWDGKNWFLFQPTYFLKPNLLCSHTLGCGAIHWSMADLLEDIPLKKTDPPSSSFHLLVASHLGLAFCVQISPTLWDFYLTWMCIGSLHTVTTSLSLCNCLFESGKLFLFHHSLPVALITFHAPTSSWLMPCLGERRKDYLDAQFRVWSFHSFCLLHIEQLWISVLIVTHCKRSFSDMVDRYTNLYI